MTNKGFSSPREEALEIAHQTRKLILTGHADAVSVLRACLVIAENLNKGNEKKWISAELFGVSVDDIPLYRTVSSEYSVEGVIQDGFTVVKLHYPVHLFVEYTKRNQTLNVVGKEKTYHVTVFQMANILASIIDKCLLFLDTVTNELQYGGFVEYLMEEIRRTTDERLATLDSKIADETHSLFLNLTSTNPADWTKVGHSCRKILKLLADKTFPPSNEKYTAKDGRSFEVQDSNVINRLCAFLDQKCSGEERKLMVAETEYLDSYLAQTVVYAQMVEHNPSIEKFDADMLAIHTYLVASEILRYIPS